MIRVSPAAVFLLLLPAALRLVSAEVFADVKGTANGTGNDTAHVTTTQTPVAVDTRRLEPEVNATLPEVEPPHVAAKQTIGGAGLKLPLTEFAMKIVLGGRCGGDRDCSVMNHSVCADGLCACQPGYIPSKHSLQKCLKVPTGLGDACEEEAQCAHAVADSDCADSVCQCPPGYVFAVADQPQKPPRCWIKQVVGGACNVSKQCEDVIFADCLQGVCSCEPPLVPGPTDTKCLQPAGSEYGAGCAEDIQCTVSYGDESRCSHGQCRCVNAYHYNGSYCLPDLPLGASCTCDLDCAVSEPEGEAEVRADGWGGSSRICLPTGCACAPGFARLTTGEHICSPVSAGQELVVTFTWLACILVAKYFS